MKYGKLLALSIGSLSLLAPAFADTQAGSVETTTTQTNIADKGPVGKGPGCGGRGGMKRDRLNLTDAQKEKVLSLKNAMHDSIGPKKVELSKEMRGLKDLLTKPTIDRAAVLSSQSKINGLKSDISNILVAFKVDFAEQLTPEQRQQMRFSPSFGKHHGGPRHGGGHMKGGPGRGPRGPVS